MGLTAAAEGYQVNTLSARQGGMAHTGVAQRLGAESIFFNPAGLGFMESAADIAGSFNAVLASASATNADGRWTTSNDPSTPFMAGAAFSIYDNLKAGISLYTPYGSGIDWGQSWPGAVLSQSVALKAFTLQPTLSWRILPGLSVGAGVMISWGTVNLDKGLINPVTMDRMVSMLYPGGEVPLFGTTTPASINLTGRSGLAAGFNIGAMYEIDPRWSVGVSYRSRMTLRVDRGDASLSYANAVAQQMLEGELGIIDHADFTAEMPLPSVLTFGAAWRPAPQWLVALDAQLTGWHTYRRLDISFPDPAISGFDQKIEKHYRDSWAFRLGAQYSVTPRLDLRAGCIVDLTPVNTAYYNPETPGMTKVEPSLGLSFRPLKGLSVDLSVLYVAGLGQDGASCAYADLLAPKLNALLPPSAQLPVTRTFTADYRCHAWVPSIGLGYSF